MSKPNLIEGVDYYYDVIDGIRYKVFTEHYLSKRGFCCKNNCRHCAYGFTKKIKKTSLEEFNDVVENIFPAIKKYIVSSNEYHITIDDPMGDLIFGSNKELSALFEYPSKFPIKKITTTYKEKQSCFIIIVDLK